MVSISLELKSESVLIEFAKSLHKTLYDDSEMLWSFKQSLQIKYIRTIEIQVKYILQFDKL